MDSYFSQSELDSFGFSALGTDVKISKKASIYAPEKIHIGNNVRIDDFSFLSGGVGIYIGDYVHIGTNCSLYGKMGIYIDSYVNVSGRVSIYSTSDDYSGEYMTGPLVPQECIRDIGGPVRIGKHVIIGTGSTVLPNVTLMEGTAVGAMSLIKNSTESFSIYAGIPARKIKFRSMKLKEFERKIPPTM